VFKILNNPQNKQPLLCLQKAKFFFNTSREQIEHEEKSMSKTSSEAEYHCVALAFAQGVASLEIKRPEALNALNAQVLHELGECVEKIRSAPDVSVVVLRSQGEKAFVAGADIKEMATLTPSEAQAFSELGSRVFQSLNNLPQVVIARVQGFALGGGLELALSADFIVASNRAKFGLPEVSLGLIPGFGGTQLLSRRIGLARALEWISTGDKYTAEQALQAGLLNSIVTPEDLDAAIERMVASMLRNGPAALRTAKRVARRGANMSLADASLLESAEFGLRFGTPESSEGMAAFLEKRAAKFPPL
jgi:enoyl-CoA hydratase